MFSEVCKTKKRSDCSVSKVKEEVNYSAFYKAWFPTSTHDGFLGISFEIRSSTRACSRTVAYLSGLSSGCSIPTLYKFTYAFISLSCFVPQIDIANTYQTALALCVCIHRHCKALMMGKIYLLL